MWKAIIKIILVIILSKIAFGQSLNNEPVLLDEFGKITLEDIMARLDRVSVEIQNRPNSKALFLIYGERLESGNNPLIVAELIEAYWKNTRKFPTDKLIIKNCFLEENVRTRVWIVWDNKIPEYCENNLKMPEESMLFETIHFYQNEHKLFPLKKSYVEVGPSETTYSENSLEIVKEFLNQSSENKIYIVSYLGKNPSTKYIKKNEEYVEKKVRNLDTKSIFQKRLNNAKKEMLKNGIKKLQIITINGGYVDDFGRLEFWFVPKGGEIPKPDPD